MSSESGTGTTVARKNSIQSIMSSDNTQNPGPPPKPAVSVKKVFNSVSHPVVVIHKTQPKPQVQASEPPKPNETKKISLPVPDLFSLGISIPTAQAQMPQRQPYQVQRNPSYPEFQQISQLYPQFQSSVPVQNMIQVQSSTISSQQNYYQQKQQTFPHFSAQTQIQGISQLQASQPMSSISQISLQPTPHTVQSFSSSQNFSTSPQQNQYFPTPLAGSSSSRLPIPIPHPAVTLPKANQHFVQPPEPIYYNDKRAGRYGIRCVCCEGRSDTGLIQCDICGFWLHTRCVNVARVAEKEPYYCPFCTGQRIRCKCDKAKNYSDSIVQCTNCKFWCHKECEGLEYGFVPKDFVCSFCQPGKTYDIPFHSLIPQELDLQSDIAAECSTKIDVLDSILDGPFKDMVTDDLNKGEMMFCDTMAKYFNHFAPLLFERIHEFWRCFSDTFTAIFDVDKKLIMQAIDVLANKLIYNSSVKASYQSINSFDSSEAISPNLAMLSLTKLDKKPEEVQVYVKNERIFTKEPIEDNQLILEIPGFLEHYDEVRADNGIPYSCISVTNKEYVIDVSGSTHQKLANIKRSFHFNCIVKMIKIGGEVRVALYSTRPTGPLSDDKGRRGPAIQADQELVLPLDGFIPFSTQKVEWKEKKARPKPAQAQTQLRSPSPPPTTRSRQYSPPPLPLTRDKKKKKAQQEKKKKQQEEDVHLSLLSAFSFDVIPPIPIILVSEKEEKAKQQQEKKSTKRRKHFTD